MARMKWLLLSLCLPLEFLFLRSVLTDTPSQPPSFNITIKSSDEVGLFFVEDLQSGKQEILFNVTIKNNQPVERKITYSWSLSDYYGKKLKEGKVKNRVLEAGGVEAFTLHFRWGAEIKRLGWYPLVVFLEAGKENAKAESAIAIIPRPQPGKRENSLFGVAANPNEERAFYALQKIGARWLRSDAGTSWLSNEPEKGKFDWSRFDRLVEWCEKYQLWLLPILDYAPDWAKPKGPDGKPYQYLDAPEKVEDYADYVRAVLQRYRGKLKYYEIWNEPYVMGWTWRNTAEHYRSLLRSAYTVAKEVDPEAVIIASGGSASHLNDVLFVKGAESSSFVDETSTHTYGAGTPEDDFFGKAERSVLLSKKFGKTKVWDTEQGWQLWDSPQMARWVPRTYVLSAIAGLRQLDWFTLASEDMGLFKPDYTPRASAATYAVCASFLEDCILVEDLFPYSRYLWGAVFKHPSGKKVAVLWTTVGRGRLILKEADKIQAYDMFGNPIGERKKDEYLLPLSDEVLYLVTDQDQLTFLQNLRGAMVRNLPPLEVMIQPFLEPIQKSPSIQVLLRNHWNRPIEGYAELQPPPGWKLTKAGQRFPPIQPGQTLTLEFPVLQAVVNPKNRYPVSLRVVPETPSFRTRLSGQEWKIDREQTLFVAAAVKGSPTLDGDLSDWKSAFPVYADTPAFVSPWCPESYRKKWTPGILSATVYTMWDEENFYIAAEVQDDVHSQSSFAENPYALPFDGDTLQIAFGVDAEDPHKLKSPRDKDYYRGLIFDTDYEYAISLTPRGTEVFRLHTPETGYYTYYPTNPDLGLGLVPSAKAFIHRDDVKERTIYEVAIPWTELRMVKGKNLIRFAFLITDRDKGGMEGWIESPAGAGVLKGNEMSFSPYWRFTTANLVPWAFIDLSMDKGF